MNRNMGSADRWVRIVIGVAVGAAGLYFKSWLGLIGLVPLATAAIGGAFFAFALFRTDHERPSSIRDVIANFPCVPQKLLTRVGDLDPARFSFAQSNAQVGFKRLDRLGNGRLRDRQHLRRARYTSLLGGRYK